MARSAVQAVRIVIFAFAAGAATAAVWMTREEGGSSSSGGNARYVCPMHPEVTAPEAGQCPICFMSLQMVGAGFKTPRDETMAMGDVSAVENIRKHKIIDFVRPHSLPFELREVRGPAWIDGDGKIVAVLYKDEIRALAADERGFFSLTRDPKVKVAVRRTADPMTPWDGSTSQLRFEIEPAVSTRMSPARRFDGGEAGWLEVPARSREVLGVPTSAILQSPDGPYVLTPSSVGGFERHPIEIGETFARQGFAVVLSGLRPHDHVVARAAFFLDADRRLGGGVDAEVGGWATK